VTDVSRKLFRALPRVTFWNLSGRRTGKASSGHRHGLFFWHLNW